MRALYLLYLFNVDTSVSVPLSLLTGLLSDADRGENLS